MNITPELLSEAERVWLNEAQLKTNSQAKNQFICDYINSKLPAKTEYSGSKNNWTIRASDTHCTWEYTINGRPDVSIQDVIDNATNFLCGTIVNKKHINAKPVSPKPFVIPPPPEGREWHIWSYDTVTHWPDDSGDWRFFLRGEEKEADDLFWNGSKWEAICSIGKANHALTYATKRPLPKAEPHFKWQKEKDAQDMGEKLEWKYVNKATWLPVGWIIPSDSPHWNDPQIEFRIAKPATKPWTLSAHMIENYGRDFANGEKPHRDDFTEEMLKGGWRPVMAGEKTTHGDEYRGEISGNWIQQQHEGKTPEIHKRLIQRTRRPLPSLAKTVPWDSPQDLANLGAVVWLRPKGCVECSMLLGISNDGVEMAVHDYDGKLKLMTTPWSKLADDDAEYSTDRITWKPCTREVQP